MTGRLAFLLAALVALADLITTEHGIGLGAHEGNPLGAPVYAAYGIAGLAALKVIVLAGIALLFRLCAQVRMTWLATFTALGAATIWGVAVAINVSVIRALLFQ